jgi:hypothetical protein
VGLGFGSPLLKLGGGGGLGAAPTPTTCAAVEGSQVLNSNVPGLACVTRATTLVALRVIATRYYNQVNCRD